MSWRAGTETQHFVTSTGRASLFPLLPPVTIAASLIGSWWCWGRLDRNVMLEVVGRGLWVLAGDAGDGVVLILGSTAAGWLRQLWHHDLAASGAILDEG